MRQLLPSLLGVVILSAVMLAAEKRVTLPADNPMGELKPGAGVEIVRANCIACHSTDYIVLQPGRGTKQWEAEVKKMITVFGAPISESDVKIIVQYLASAYGPQSKTTPPNAKTPGKSPH